MEWIDRKKIENFTLSERMFLLLRFPTRRCSFPVNSFHPVILSKNILPPSIPPHLAAILTKPTGEAGGLVQRRKMYLIQ